MRSVKVRGVRLLGVEAALGAKEVDNYLTCKLLFGEKAEAILKTTGILKRRVAEEGETSLSLCVKAAQNLMARLGTKPEEIAGVVSVTFTPRFQMPGNAQLAQRELGLASDVAAIDLNHACAGYPYALYVAARLAQDLGGKVLVLDGDVQTRLADASTAALLSDAGSATLIEPGGDEEWKFAFWTDGVRADDLKVEGGKIRMDGFGVFRFVAGDVGKWTEEFMAGEQVESFVPHQANVYMVKELAKQLGLEDQVAITGHEVGNCASASIPVTLARTMKAGEKRRTLLVGFGGGLSAAMAIIDA